MNKKSIVTAIVSLFLATSIYAQEEQQEPEKPNTIDQQFTDLMTASNNFQEYKVVKRTGLENLKSNTRDSINSLQREIDSYKNQLREQKSEIDTLNTSLTDTKTDLDTTREKIDAINFLGIPMDKGSYKGMMWGLIVILALALLFFIYRFRGSNAHTKEARKKLNETEQEFDIYRKKALEKEQILGRQLQDERNKAVRNTKG